MAELPEDKPTTKRVTRARASASKATKAKAAPRATAAETAPRAPAKRTTARSVSRKAPPRVVQNKDSSKVSQTKFKVVAVLAFCVTVIGAVSYAIGVSDQGAINVNAAISNQIVAGTDADGNVDTSAAEAMTVPQTDRPRGPNAGLVGRGNRDTEQQRLERAAASLSAEPASTTASSSEATASSTAALPTTEPDATTSESEPTAATDTTN